MKPRKTASIPIILQEANKILAAPNTTEQMRAGVCLLTNNILHTNDVYAGYGYLPSEFLSDGSALKPDADYTRRVYYYHTALQGK